MAVFVDRTKNKFGRMVMCHMLADTLDELHEMARKIGLNPFWFQKNASTPHYDLSLTKRYEAIKNGAIEADKYKVVELIRKYRADSNQGSAD